tara:strand:+ start:665 stop:937 length:273 start_codon:yes stop_codon:yes gene_type:complete
MSQIFKFKDTSISIYTIEAESEKEAIKILDKLWWTKTKSIKNMIDKQEIKVLDKIYITYKNPKHKCTNFIFGDDEDKKYCEDCWSYQEND